MSGAPKPNPGMLGAVVLVCAALLASGFAFQFAATDNTAFWAGADLGGALTIGAAAGGVVVAIVRIGEMLSSRTRNRAKKGGGVEPHA